jgi:hypothetical protein
MTGENVEYQVSLKDFLSSKLKGAEVEATKLERSIGGVSSSLMKFAAIGITAFAGFDFIHSSIEAYNEAAQSSAQLTASLRSTGAESWTTKTALDAQAESLMKLSLFDDDVITKSQSILLTFRSVRGEIFNQAIPAIADLATKMGTDLNSATVQVGKALEDPIRGITALRRVGVSFNDTQVKTIKHMVEMGEKSKAQAMILRELQTEFGGSAEAASRAGTGPFTVLAHQFQNVKEEVGELAMKLVIKLYPAF